MIKSTGVLTKTRALESTSLNKTSSSSFLGGNGSATLAERRALKKIAQPEHAYTGYIPRWVEPEEQPVERKRNPPILGYKGHLHNQEDMIGTTFSHGLRQPNTLQHQKQKSSLTHKKTEMDDPFGDYTQQEQFLTAPPRRGQMSERSGYGKFEDASGYGQFMDRPDDASGYGAFEDASGYGQFMERPDDVSGYGAFEDASGYGQFMEKSDDASGYGAFDDASGYGQFMERPESATRSTQPKKRVESSSNLQQVLKYDFDLYKKYQRTVCLLGGETQVRRLLDGIMENVYKRYHRRTEIVQHFKRCFLDQVMSKDQFKIALGRIPCVFSDDQVTALFSLYDTQCKGKIQLDPFLQDLYACIHL